LCLTVYIILFMMYMHNETETIKMKKIYISKGHYLSNLLTYQIPLILRVTNSGCKHADRRY
jgi:hypothetical protein